MGLVIYNQEMKMVMKNQKQTDRKGDHFVKRKNQLKQKLY